MCAAYLMAWGYSLYTNALCCQVANIDAIDLYLLFFVINLKFEPLCARFLHSNTALDDAKDEDPQMAAAGSPRHIR